MKNLNEEIKRMKSLFDESRLYGNLNESTGGRFGWLDDLFSVIDDAHASKGMKKWSEFSMTYKNADEFLNLVKRNPDYVKLIDEDFPTYIGKLIDEIATTGSVTKRTTDLLSDGYMKSILDTFRKNGADITMDINYNGINKSISQHIQDAWSTSTQKQMIDDLQTQILKRIESEATWHPDVNVEEIFSDIRSQYGDEIKLLKTSDTSDDVITKTINTINGIKLSKNIDYAKVMKKMADDAARIGAKEDIGKLHAEYVSMVRDLKRRYATKLNKIISGDINPKRAIFTTDNPIVSRLAKLKAWENTRFSEDRILRLLGDFDDDRIIPLLNTEGLSDLFLLGQGKTLHAFIKKWSAGGKLLKDTKIRYKLFIYGYSIAQNYLIFYVLTDLWKIIWNNIPFLGGLSPTEKLYENQETYIFNFGGMLSSECYELKGYEDGTSEKSIETKSGVYKEKNEYILWVKKQRRQNGDEWFPENFCEYFICKDGKPVSVSCAKYSPLVGEEGTLGDKYETIDNIGNSIEEIKDYVSDSLINNKIPDQFDNIMDSVKVKYDNQKENFIDSEFFKKLTPEQQKKLLEALDEEIEETANTMTSEEAGMD